MDKKYKRLKQALNLRGMKQVELSKITGISKSMISEYVSGKHFPKDDNIYKICKALNISEVWLMGLTEDITRMSDEERKQIAKNNYNTSTEKQKQNFQNQTLERIKNFFDEDTYNLVINYLDCNSKGKEWLNERSKEAVKLYPKD